MTAAGSMAKERTPTRKAKIVSAPARERIPATMKAWVIGAPDELHLTEKPVPQA